MDLHAIALHGAENTDGNREQARRIECAKGKGICPAKSENGLRFRDIAQPEFDQHEESLGAYAKLLEQGKIRSVGCSNYDASLLQASFDAADKAGLPRYQAVQPEYNLYERSSFEGSLADLCVKEDIGVITYFSLAAGFLSGKYRSKADTEGRAREGRVSQYLNDKGM